MTLDWLFFSFVMVEGSLGKMESLFRELIT